MASTSTPPISYTTPLFGSVKSSNLSPATQHWLSRVLYALDQKDVSAYCEFMTDDVCITFNNGEQGQPNMTGIDTVRAGLTAFWKGFNTIRHEEVVLTEAGNTVMHEALNHYETLDGRKVTLRAVAVLDRNTEEKIHSIRIYSDQSPLWKT